MSGPVFTSGSIRVATLNGIAVEIHFTFLLAILWGAWQGWVQYKGVTGIGFGVLTVLLLFACILFHELAHGWQAKALGLVVRRITLLPIGGLAQLATPPATPLHELMIAIAGPAANLLLAGIFAVAGYFLNAFEARNWVDVLLILTVPSMPGLILYLFSVNLSLFVLNMIPAFPMDGGRVLRSVLALGTNYLLATRISAWLGRLIAAGMVILGIIGWPPAGIYPNPFLLPFLIMVGAVVYFGALNEETGVRRQWALARVEVKDIYRTQAETVSPWETLSTTLIANLFKRERPLPVVLDGRIVGLLTYQEARRHLNPTDRVTVAHAMRIDFPVLALRDTLWVALQDMSSHNLPLLPVVDNDLFCGVVSLDDINQAWRFVTGL
jgi:Zn-dependent protease/CBS domain-containing protein